MRQIHLRKQSLVTVPTRSPGSAVRTRPYNSASIPYILAGISEIQIGAAPMFRLRAFLAFTALVLTLALATSQVDARPGFGGSFGSRGTRTFTPPPVTRT